MLCKAQIIYTVSENQKTCFYLRHTFPLSDAKKMDSKPVDTSHESDSSLSTPSSGTGTKVHPTSKSNHPTTNSDCLSWTIEQLRTLKFLAYHDTTLSAITQYLPDISVDTILEKLLTISGAPLWTRGEVMLIANFKQCVSSFDPQEFPTKTREQVEQKLQEISSVIASLRVPDSWSKRDVSSLVYLLEYDMTLCGVLEEFPDFSIDDIKNAVQIGPWTPTEVFYLRVAKFEETELLDILEELPFRSESEVSFLLREVEPLELNLDPLTVQYVKTYHGTRSGLKLYFPDIPTREVVAAADAFKQGGLQSEEEKILKLCSDENRTLAYIKSLLPFMSTGYIERKLESMLNAYRRTGFKNQVEELIYMSQWYASDKFSKSSRSRRRQVQQVELEDAFKTEEEAKLTLEEFKEKKLKMEQVEQRRIQQRDELRQQKIREREARLADPNYKPTTIKNAPTSSRYIEQLATEAAYFQSVTGDKQLVKDNEKRKRPKTVFFIPQFEDRKILKKLIKQKAKEKSKKRLKSEKSTSPKKIRKTSNKTSQKVKVEESPEIEESVSSEDFELEDDDEEDEQEPVSPFDPYDITVDTVLDTNGRQLFNDCISSKTPSIPDLHFRPEDLSIDILEEMDPSLYQTDVLSAKIVLDFPKRYKDLGDSFPPLYIINSEGNKILNPQNRIRLRTLLYPEHTELFILAAPKQNELNPLFEIQKFFQIHFCLYFSHSEKLKDIVYNGFCIGIEKAVEQNDFSSFLSYVDKWNLLMLVLSPTYKGNALTHVDVNLEVRDRAGALNYIVPTLSSSDLDVFFNEICSSPKFLTLTDESTSLKDSIPPNINLGTSVTTINTKDSSEINEPITPTVSNGSVIIQTAPNMLEKSDGFYKAQAPAVNVAVPELSLETNYLTDGGLATVDTTLNNSSTIDSSITSMSMVNTRISSPKTSVSRVEPSPPCLSETEEVAGFTRPGEYISYFFNNIHQKTSISRYCMQQLLIRVYARVVSTRSNELRRYKAFTAEVYGELLPSFVSEVLTKVNFKPNQKFYDLGSGVGNTSFQAAIEFGASFSGGCELMEHASRLTSIQEMTLEKHLKVFGLKPLNMRFALAQSFVDNENVRKDVLDCDVLLVNNYLFDMKLNFEVGKLLYGLRPGSKIISLKNFITPRYKSNGDDTVFDYLEVEKHEMSDFFSVSWTANKVPYYISTVMPGIRPQYLTR